MHPPRGCRQSNLRSAVAQKGPARHLTCWRAPGAGLSPFAPAQIERGPNTPYRLIPRTRLGSTSLKPESLQGNIRRAKGRVL